MIVRTAAVALSVLVLCLGCSSDEAPIEQRADPGETSSTTAAGTERLDAPDLGCVASLESRAIDYTGGADDLADALAVEFAVPDAEVVAANEKYAWVISTAGNSRRRALFIDGGSGWALLRLDSCALATGEPHTPVGL